MSSASGPNIRKISTGKRQGSRDRSMRYSHEGEHCHSPDDGSLSRCSSSTLSFISFASDDRTQHSASAVTSHQLGSGYHGIAAEKGAVIEQENSRRNNGTVPDFVATTEDDFVHIGPEAEIISPCCDFVSKPVSRKNYSPEYYHTNSMRATRDIQRHSKNSMAIPNVPSATSSDNDFIHDFNRSTREILQAKSSLDGVILQPRGNHTNVADSKNANSVRCSFEFDNNEFDNNNNYLTSPKTTYPNNTHLLETSNVDSAPIGSSSQSPHCDETTRTIYPPVHAVRRSRDHDDSQQSPDDFVQTSSTRRTPSVLDFVKTAAAIAESTNLPYQPNLVDILSGSVKESKLLKRQSDFVSNPLIPKETIKSRRKSEPDSQKDIKRFLQQKKVIHMDQESDGRCTHMEVTPSSMMTLAMELLMPSDSKASALFKEARKKADGDTGEKESILPTLWVVPKASSENDLVETTALHLKPRVEGCDNVRKQMMNVAQMDEEDRKGVSVNMSTEKVPSPLPTLPSNRIFKENSAELEQQYSENKFREEDGRSEIRDEDVIRDLQTLTVADLVGAPDTIYSDTESEFETDEQRTNQKDITDRPVTTCVLSRSASPKLGNFFCRSGNQKISTDHPGQQPQVECIKEVSLPSLPSFAKLEPDQMTSKRGGRLLCGPTVTQPGSQDRSPDRKSWHSLQNQALEQDLLKEDVLDVKTTRSSSLSSSTSFTTVSSLSLSSATSSKSSASLLSDRVISDTTQSDINMHDLLTPHVHAISNNAEENRSNIDIESTSESSSAEQRHERIIIPEKGSLFKGATASITPPLLRKSPRIEHIKESTIEKRSSAAYVCTDDDMNFIDQALSTIRPQPVQAAVNVKEKMNESSSSSSSPIPAAPPRGGSLRVMESFRRKKSGREANDIGAGSKTMIRRSIGSEDVIQSSERILIGDKEYPICKSGSSSFNVNDKIIETKGGFQSSGNLPSSSCAKTDEAWSNVCINRERSDNETATKQSKLACDTTTFIAMKQHPKEGNSLKDRLASNRSANQADTRGNSGARACSHNDVITDSYLVVEGRNGKEQSTVADLPELHTIAHRSSKQAQHTDSAFVSVGDSNHEGHTTASSDGSIMLARHASNNAVTVVDGSRVSLVGSSGVKSRTNCSTTVNDQRNTNSVLYLSDLIQRNPSQAKDEQQLAKEAIVMPSIAASIHNQQGGGMIGDGSRRNENCELVSPHWMSEFRTSSPLSPQNLPSYNARAKPFVISPTINKTDSQAKKKDYTPVFRPKQEQRNYTESLKSGHGFDSASVLGKDAGPKSICEELFIIEDRDAVQEHPTEDDEMNRRTRNVVVLQTTKNTSGNDLKPIRKYSFGDGAKYGTSINGGNIQSVPGSDFVISGSQSTEDILNKPGGGFYSSSMRIALRPGASGKNSAEKMTSSVSMPVAVNPPNIGGHSNFKPDSSRIKMVVRNTNRLHGSQEENGSRSDESFRNQSNWSLRQVPRKKVREVAIPEMKVREEAQNTVQVNKRDVPLHSTTEDDEDFAGVVDGPSKNVKEIRAMFKRGPDYANYAKPKLTRNKPAPTIKSNKEFILGPMRESKPSTEVAQKVIGLFKGALSFDEVSATEEHAVETKPVPNGADEQHSDGPQISVKDKVASFNIGKSPVIEKLEVNNNQHAVVKETPLKTEVKSIAHAHYTEIITNPKSHLAENPASPKRGAPVSYDESLDEFYGILEELTTS